MPKELPRGVSADRDRHGNPRLYYRKNGKRVRLREAPGTREFNEEVACALLGVPYKSKAEGVSRYPGANDERSLGWLVSQYRKRAKVSEGHRFRIVRMLEEVCQSTHRGKFKRGALPFALMERKHVLKIRDELRPASSPGAQNNVVRAISSLFTWAIGGHCRLAPPTRVARDHRRISHRRSQFSSHRLWKGFHD